MSLAPPLWAESEIDYPSEDGNPMSENTLQFQWIVTIQGGLDALFRNEPQVFVAGDLLWYPVEGDHTTRVATDTMVVFGRPKGHRGSYMQWREANVAPQVVFDILSPGNRAGELVRKLGFYERYGVEECYIYDPDHGDLVGWIRKQGQWQEIPGMPGWVSPRLGIRFEIAGGELELYTALGEKFATYLELSEQRAAARREAEQSRQTAERLAAQLRTLGVEPDL